MKTRYNCYGIVIKLLLLFPFAFTLCGLYVNLFKVETIDKTTVSIILVLLAVWIFGGLETFRTVVVDDEKVSVRNMFFRKKTMYFSEIRRFYVERGQYEKILILEGDGEKIKLTFCELRFVLRMREILRRQLHGKIQQELETIKKSGIYIGGLTYGITLNENGITNLKTNKNFLWHEIKCEVAERKSGKIYRFELEKKISVGFRYDDFRFAFEDFLDEMVKKCASMSR